MDWLRVALVCPNSEAALRKALVATASAPPPAQYLRRDSQLWIPTALKVGTEQTSEGWYKIADRL